MTFLVWLQKIIYDGNASEMVSYDAFQLFMEGKGLRIAYRDTPIYKKDLYIIEPATTLTCLARKRMVPRGLDLWHVRITLSGHRIDEVETLFDSFFEQKP